MAVETRPQRFSLQRPALDGPTDLPGRAQWAVGIGAGRGGGPLAAGAQQRNTWTCSMPSGLKQAAPAARQAPPHPSSTSCRPGTKILRPCSPSHSDGPSSPPSRCSCSLNFLTTSSALLELGDRLLVALCWCLQSEARNETAEDEISFARHEKFDYLTLLERLKVAASCRCARRSRHPRGMPLRGGCHRGPGG